MQNKLDLSPILGFDTYHKILDDAIQELKETEFKELFAEELSEKAKLVVPDCVIETDLEILIPDTYINNTSERLQLYATLDNIKDEESLNEIQDSLKRSVWCYCLNRLSN